MSINRGILISLLGISFFIGCSRQKDVTLELALVGTPQQQFNVFNASSSTSMLRTFLYHFITTIDKNGDWVAKPLIIKEVDIMTWEIIFDEDLFLHNGNHVDIQDLAFSISTAFKFPANLLSYGNTIKSIEVITPNKLLIKLEQPNNDIPYLLSHVSLLKKRNVDSFQDLNEKWLEVNGTGPFTVKAFNQKKIVLKAFPQYFLSEPKIDQINVHFYDSTERMWNDVVTGRLDLVNALWLDIARIKAIENEASLRLYKFLYNYCYSLLFNSNQGFFSDPEIRDAFDEYIDKQAIVDQVLQGEGMVAQSTLKFVPFGSNRSIVEQSEKKQQNLYAVLIDQGYKFNKNKRLLNPAGEPVVLKALLDQGNLLGQYVFRSIMEQLLEVGIDLEIIEYNPNVLVSDYLTPGNFDMIFFYFRTEPYADFNYRYWHSDSIENGYNFGRYCNPEMDDALERGRRAASEKEKIQAYADFVREFEENPPASLLFFRNNYVITSDRLQNYHPHSLDWTPNPHLWTLK